MTLYPLQEFTPAEIETLNRFAQVENIRFDDTSQPVTASPAPLGDPWAATVGTADTNDGMPF